MDSTKALLEEDLIDDGFEDDVAAEIAFQEFEWYSRNIDFDDCLYPQ